MYSMAEPIIYNGVDFNTVQGLTILGYDTFRPAANELNTYDIVLSDKAVATSRNEHRKKINIRMNIARSGRELLEESLDDLNGIVKQLNKTLDVPLRNDRYIYRNTSYSNMSISNVQGGYAEIEVELETTDPFSYAKGLTTALASTTYTTVPRSLVVNFDGNTKQLPIITLFLDSVGSTTSERYIKITNQYSGEYIQISRVYSSDETLVIDAYNQQVTVDGTLVDYTGRLFEASVTDLAFTAEDNFISRVVDAKVEYYKRYS